MENFLDDLPPPPDVPFDERRTRGPTRDSIPTGREMMIVDTGPPPKQNATVLPLPQVDSEYVDPETEPIIHERNYRKEDVLMRITMEESEVSCRVVPHVLRNGRRYPEKCSTICCWWDKSRFTGRPVGCPYKYEHKSNTFHCEGIFCSYSCAKAYGLNSGREKMRFCGSLLIKMRKVIDKINYVEPLDSSPHWSTLKSFGGFLSLSSFRNFASMSYRLHAIPEQMRCFLYGFNIFEARENHNTAIHTYKALRERGSTEYRKNSHGVKERAKKRRLTDSVSKVISRIKTHKKKSPSIKARHIEKFLNRRQKKKTIEL